MKKAISKLFLSAIVLLGVFSTTAIPVKAATQYNFAVTSSAKVIDNKGDQVGVLPIGSTWKASGVMTGTNDNPDYLYTVAPNQFVSAKDGYLYLPQNQVVKTSSTQMVHLYDHTGKEIGNRALGPNTLWRSDRIMFMNKMTYYRVATDEFAVLVTPAN